MEANVKSTHGLKLIDGSESVTFRKKSPREIIELARKAGLDGIEWGGDVHATSPEAAKEIRRMMEELSVFSLGSYYNAGSGTKYARGTGYSVTPISSTSKRLNSVTRYKAGTYVGVLYNAGSVATYYPATETLYKAGTNIGKLYNAGTISTDYYTKS